MLRDQNKALYDHYVESPSVADQVIKFIGQGLSLEERQDTYFCFMSAHLIAPNSRERFDELIKQYKRTEESANYSGNSKVSKLTGRISSPQGYKHTIERIEFSQQFAMDT
jgi:hypothetical protein